MNSDEAVKVAARERLLAAELVQVLDVPVEAVDGRAGPPRRAGWLAAALVLLGVFVAGGVAWLRAHEDAVATQGREPFDPVFPRLEQQPEFVTVVGAEQLAKVPDDVVALSVEVDDLDALASLQRCRGLQYLFIQDKRGSHSMRRETLRAIASLPRLEYLVLPGLQTTTDDLRELRAAPQLRSLMLGGSPFVLDAELAAVLVELPKLRDLSFWDVQLRPEGLAALAGLPDLEYLMTGRVTWDAECLAAIGSLRQLRALVLHGVGAGDRMPMPRLDAAGARELARLPRLSVLALESLVVDDEALAALPVTLERFGIGQLEGLTGPGLRSLARLPKLRALGVQFRERDVWWDHALVELVRALPLERFDSLASPLSPAMWQALQQKPRLRGLWMRCPERGAPDLAPCAQLRALEVLDLSFPKELTPEALEPLRDLPQLRTVVVTGLAPEQRRGLAAFVLRPGVDLRFR